MIVKAYVDALLIHEVGNLALPTALRSTELDSGPPPDVSSENRPRTHGSRNNSLYYEARAFPLSGYAMGATDVATTAAIDALKLAFLLNGKTKRLRFLRAGASVEEFLDIVPVGRFEAPMEGYQKRRSWAIAVEAPDPRMYSMTLQTITLPAGGATLIQGDVTPGGSITTPPLIEITGPGRISSVANTTAGLTFHLVDDLLAAGAVMQIDCAKREIKVNGVLRPELIVARDTNWWELLPAVANRVVVTATSGMTGATVVKVIFRDARA